MNTSILKSTGPAPASLSSLRNETNRLLESAFLPTGWPGAFTRMAQPFAPPLDVLETAESYLVQLDVPGCDPESLEVQLEGRSLTIRGQRPHLQVAGGEALHAERTHGNFCRTLNLPAGVEPDGVTAEQSQGVLTVTVPKAEAARARRVPIENRG